MPATRQTSRRHLRRPWAGVLLALALLSAFVDGAAGVTKEEVADAEARVTRLEREIRARETRLEILQEVAASLAAELSLAQGELERIGWELSETRARLATAQSKYERLRARLDGRAREAYMDGPASGLEFLLGSTSLADLSDRIEFVNSVVQADAVGAGSPKDLVDASIAYFTLRGRVLQSTYDWNLAIAGLRRAAGEYAATPGRP